MKNIFLIIVCSWCLAVSLRAETNDVPPVVIAGLKAYQTNSANAAYEAWSKGSLENDRASRQAVMSGLRQMEGLYGKMKDYDLLKTVKIGSYVRRTYVVILYERGPA